MLLSDFCGRFMATAVLLRKSITSLSSEDAQSLTWTVDRDGWLSYQDPGLPREMHVKIHTILQGVSSMASDWLAAVPSAVQMPSLKTFVS